MGIAGLHGLLKSIQKPCNLKKFKGQTLGVDAYGWLHRGTVACAMDLALGKHTTKYVDFAMNRVRMLLYFGVTPYLIFDGDNLPSKAETEASRAARREESRKLGLELYKSGRTSQAYQELQKAVDVTPYMARMLIEELKKINIQYVVAPYEADAQLVYLEKQGIINGIISEDSDMLVFGAKRLLSKLDQHGDCIEINRSDFTACREVSLVGWSDASFRQMCILSGCDYLPSIPSMGLKTAYRVLRKHRTIERVLKMIQFDGKSRVPPDYLDNFKRAELTFLHQWVFCPTAKRLVMLSPLESTVDVKMEELTFIGADLDPEIAIGIACGDIDPMTKEPIYIKPSYPERARMVPSRRQTLPTADLKPNKSINAFFTPKRVPLGELDPNSLTPSPSQQRLLERNSNASWRATPTNTTGHTPLITRSAPSVTAPRPALERRQTQQQQQNTDRESFLARAAAVSKYQPPKRQRLCSDADEDTLPSNEEIKRSRFFGQPKGSSSEASQQQQNTRTKKAKKSNFGVFSDEVVEDIMAQLPSDGGPVTETTVRVVESASKDMQTNPQPVESQQSQTESARSEESEERSQPTSQSTTTTLQSSISSCQSNATSQTTMTQQSVSIESDPELFERVSEHPVKQHNSRLREKYAYNNNKQQSAPAEGTGSSAKADDNKGKPDTGAGLAKPKAATATKPQQLRLTPLQRLRNNALSRSRSMGSLTGLTKAYDDAPVKESEYDSDSTPLKSKSSSWVVGTGSEDMIVPNSEDEGEEEYLDDHDDESEQPRGRSLLDIGKFRFGAGVN